VGFALYQRLRIVCRNAVLGPSRRALVNFTRKVVGREASPHAGQYLGMQYDRVAALELYFQLQWIAVATKMTVTEAVTETAKDALDMAEKPRESNSNGIPLQFLIMVLLR